VFDLYDELKGITEDLAKHGIDYALCGGLALAVHGIARATIDIDVLVPEASLESAKALIRRHGYVLEGAPMTFASGAVRITRLTKPDPDSEDFLTVDLLEVTPPLADAWGTRQRVEWEGGALIVVSRDGLIALKRLRGSGQDQDDIAKLGAL
jgi:hypothetical protein